MLSLCQPHSRSMLYPTCKICQLIARFGQASCRLKSQAGNCVNYQIIIILNVLGNIPTGGIIQIFGKLPNSAKCLSQNRNRESHQDFIGNKNVPRARFWPGPQNNRPRGMNPKLPHIFLRIQMLKYLMWR